MYCISNVYLADFQYLFNITLNTYCNTANNNEKRRGPLKNMCNSQNLFEKPDVAKEALFSGLPPAFQKSIKPPYILEICIRVGKSVQHETSFHFAFDFGFGQC